MPNDTPDFVIPDWLQPSVPQMPPPSPDTVQQAHSAVMGGQLQDPGFVLPPELMQHVQPPQPAAPPVPKTDEGRQRAAEQQVSQGEQGVQQGIEQQSKAVEQKGSIEQQQAGDIANEYLRRNDELYGQADPWDPTKRLSGGLMQKREQEAAADQAELHKRQDAYEKAVAAEGNYKIDDRRYYKNMSTGRKIATGIALALSEFGHGLMRRDGPSPVMQMIQQSLKDDVAEQMNEQQQLGKKAERVRTSIDTYRQLTNDHQSAFNLKLAESYKRTADQIEAAGAKYASPLAKANAQQAAGQLRTQAAQLLTTTAQADASRAQQAVQHKQSMGVQYAELDLHKQQMAQAAKFHDDEVNERAAQLELAGRKEEAAELKAVHGQVAQHGILMPNGQYALMKDGSPYIAPEKSSEKLHEQYEGVLTMTDALDKLRQLRHDNGGDFNKWSTDARLKAAEYERALIGGHKAAGIAGFRGNVMEVINKATGGKEDTDPTSVIQSMLPLLDNAREDALQDFRHALHAHNYDNEQSFDIADPLKQQKPAESESQRQLRDVENEGGLHAGEAQVKEWALAAAKGDQQAVENLQRAATSAKDPTVQSIAQDALANPGQTANQLEALTRTRDLPMGLYPHLFKYETAHVAAEKRAAGESDRRREREAEEAKAKKNRKTGIRLIDEGP